MPMCDAYIPKGALPEAAERKLLSKITDLLLQHEGVAPTNQDIAAHVIGDAGRRHGRTAPRRAASRTGARAARVCPGLTNA